MTCTLEQTIQLVTWRELKEIYRLPWSRQHVGRLEKVGRFPKRVKLNNFRCCWIREEIEKFIMSCRF